MNKVAVAVIVRSFADLCRQVCRTLGGRWVGGQLSAGMTSRSKSSMPLVS